jgi:hypothetical protein
MTMKTRMAMAISIAGVLVAGSAAALVNTQVLSGSADASPFEAQAKTTEPSTTAVASAPADTSTVTTVAPAVAPAASDTTVPAAPSSTQASYAIGDSTVILDTAGDTLTIVSLTPAAGWTVTKAESHDATNVEIELQSGANELEFHANLLFGVVTTSVETKDNSTTASSVDDSHGGGHGADDVSGDSSHSHGGDD